MENEIIPSINCKDFNCIRNRFKIADEFANWAHVDISDGKFTPHISWNSPEEFATLKSEIKNLKSEIHLMVQDPEAQIDAWIRAGAKRIIVHLESITDSVYILEKCKKYNTECFLAINPNTEVDRMLVHVDDFDGFLMLAVSPGPSGQGMKMETLDKIKFLRSKGVKLPIEIDGGINLETAKQAKEAGANFFIAGSFIFNSTDPALAFGEIEKIVKS